MRRFVAGVVVGLLVAGSAVAGMAQNRGGKNGSGQIVIVFKDGHRQSFNMGEIARIEFPGGAPVAITSPGCSVMKWLM